MQIQIAISIGCLDYSQLRMAWDSGPPPTVAHILPLRNNTEKGTFGVRAQQDLLRNQEIGKERPPSSPPLMIGRVYALGWRFLCSVTRREAACLLYFYSYPAYFFVVNERRFVQYQSSCRKAMVVEF